MNENERGITPPNVTSMTIAPWEGYWHIIIEQGNGDVIKEINLTGEERMFLAALLSSPRCRTATHLEFTDATRPPRSDNQS